MLETDINMVRKHNFECFKLHDRMNILGYWISGCNIANPTEVINDLKIDDDSNF